MSALFGDEPDEDVPQRNHGLSSMFAEEPDECEDTALFRAEPAEPDSQLCPFGIEKDETEQQIVEKPDSGTDEDEDDAYEADVDEEVVSSRQQLFDLSFATMNHFMASQLCTQHGGSSSSSRPVKKRCYDNTRRAAKAAAGKVNSSFKRVPRDDPDT